MRITPLDVRKQEFKRGMRGYDADEVRAFLITLADEYEVVLVDNRQLRERMLELDEKLAEYRNLERTLRDTLMTAEKMTQEARETARKQGELLLEEARQRVTTVLAEGRAQLDELRREALAVHREKETFLGRFQSMAEAQIQFIEAHRSDFKALDGRLLDQTESTPWSRARPAQPVPVSSSSQPREQSATADQSPAPGTQAASLRPAELHDQWRDYAIKETPTGPSADVSRLADAVNDVVSDAADDSYEPDTGDVLAPAASGPQSPEAAPAVAPVPVLWPWPSSGEAADDEALKALDEVPTPGRDKNQP